LIELALLFFISKLECMTHFLKNYYMAIIIGILAFLSYNYNTFMVASNDFFQKHQLDSEQLVLDGILHGTHDNNHIILGRYTRPEINNQSLYSHELYLKKNESGVFNEYRSQFGLQLYLYNFIASKVNCDIKFLQAFSAFLMSLIVSTFFVIIKREFSDKYAFAFCLPLIISPWVVVFARNLYWGEAFWYLPIIIAFIFGKKAFSSFKRAAILLILLFLTFSIKLLCGYEYITTIAFSSCIPIIYYAAKYRIKLISMLRLLILSGITFLIAFIFTIIVHAYSLSTDTNNGYKEIYTTAARRVAITNSETVIKEFSNNPNNSDGYQEYISSLRSNGFAVVGKYFLMRHFLPWIDNFDVSPTLSYSTKSYMRQTKKNQSFQSYCHILSTISPQELRDIVIQFVVKVINYFAFIVFFVFVFIEALKQRNYISLSVLLSLFATLSWFVLAKGHSYIHYHMNYVLWYLPFIPLSMILLVNKGNKI